MKMEPPFSIPQIKALPYLTFCVNDPKSVISLLNFCHLKCFLVDQIKENEMGEHTRFWFENLNERPGHRREDTLKTDSCGARQGAVAGCPEHGNELWVPEDSGMFLAI
jgi:hypothetical protein